MKNSIHYSSLRTGNVYNFYHGSGKLTRFLSTLNERLIGKLLIEVCPGVY